VRAFVALPIPDDVAAQAQHRLAGVVEERRDLRWVPPVQWHVTLAFLGEISDDVVAKLSTRLERVSRRHGPMRLRLDAAGRFDDRVLWLGVGGDRDALRRLAASVSAAADRVGIEQAPGRYRPHLTVARARERTDLRPVVDQLSDGAGPWWSAADMTLFSSRIGPVVEHTALRSWPLHVRGAADA
jgi:2'-5' RNA ligase